jgi:DNA-binding GntR family transcriptional regulator
VSGSTQEDRTRYLTNDDVYKQLRNEILTLRIQPGETLSENYVSDRFGISRTPVRAIFMRLSEDGLLELRGRKGTFASLIDLDMAEQILFMRIQVELAAMLFLARRPNRVIFRQLAHNLKVQQGLIDSNVDNFGWYRVDSAFHSLCMTHIRKQRLWKMIQDLDVHYARYRYLDYMATREEGVFQILRGEHVKLYECLMEGKQENLRHLLTAHLYGGFLRIGTRLTSEYQSFFTESSRTINEIILDVKTMLNETK